MAEEKRRQYIPVVNKRSAWRLARGRCEDCGKKLFERILVQMPSGKLTFQVRVWNGHECWRCNLPGRVLLVFDNQECGYSYIESVKLGEAIRRRYPFFRPGYSNTMEMSYYSNHCQRCGALHGDHFVHLWAIDSPERWENFHSEPVPGVVEYTEPTSWWTRRFLPFHIHHVDGNPSSNSVDNLRILCVDCHKKVHRVEKLGT